MRYRLTDWLCITGSSFVCLGWNIYTVSYLAKFSEMKLLSTADRPNAKLNVGYSIYTCRIDRLHREVNSDRGYRAVRHTSPIWRPDPSYSTRPLLGTLLLGCGRSCQRVRRYRRRTWNLHWIRGCEGAATTSADTSYRWLSNASDRGMSELNIPTCTLQQHQIGKCTFLGP